MLNPSVADEVRSDPTIRRVEGFSGRWGFERLVVVNLWSARATKPADLRKRARPGGDARNDDAISAAVAEADKVIAAWGVHGAWRGRDQEVLALLEGTEVFCLGLTKGGHPRHPLFVPGRQPLLPLPRQEMLRS